MKQRLMIIILLAGLSLDVNTESRVGGYRGMF